MYSEMSRQEIYIKILFFLLLLFFFMIFIKNNNIKRKISIYLFIIGFGCNIGLYVNFSRITFDYCHIAGFLTGTLLPNKFIKDKTNEWNSFYDQNLAIVGLISFLIGFLSNYLIYLIIISNLISKINLEYILLIYGLINGIVLGYAIDQKIINSKFFLSEKFVAIIIFGISTFIGNYFAMLNNNWSIYGNCFINR